MTRHWVMAAMVLGLCWAPAGGAGRLAAQQEPAIELPAIGVIDEQLRAYHVGEQFKVNLQHADLARAGGAGSLYVRLFRGARNDLLGPLRYRAVDGCLIYNTGIYRAVEYNGGIKVLTPGGGGVIFTKSWLASHPDRGVRDQVYVMMLEKGAEPRSLLKIRPEDARRYFGHGFELVVKAPEAPEQRPSPAEVALLAAEEEAGRAGSLERINEAVQGTVRTTCRIFSPISFARMAMLQEVACGCRDGSTAALEPWAESAGWPGR